MEALNWRCSSVVQIVLSIINKALGLIASWGAGMLIN